MNANFFGCSQNILSSNFCIMQGDIVKIVSEERKTSCNTTAICILKDSNVYDSILLESRNRATIYFIKPI
jgi:putative hemolysin